MTVGNALAMEETGRSATLHAHTHSLIHHVLFLLHSATLRCAAVYQIKKPTEIHLSSFCYFSIHVQY